MKYTISTATPKMKLNVITTSGSSHIQFTSKTKNANILVGENHVIYIGENPMVETRLNSIEANYIETINTAW